MLCTFTGTADRITVRGSGAAELVRGAAFAEGIATSVDLLSARIGPAPPPIAIATPAGLDPVRIEPSAGPFIASYEAGKVIRIRIEAAAARGRFLGPLQAAPACAAAAGCDIEWSDPRHIDIDIHTNVALIGSKTRLKDPIRLAGKLPLAAPAATDNPSSSVAEILLEAARGTLSCGGPLFIEGESLRWTATKPGELRIKNGIFVVPEGLGIEVDSAAAPLWSPPPAPAASATAQPPASAPTTASATAPLPTVTTAPPLPQDPPPIQRYLRPLLVIVTIAMLAMLLWLRFRSRSRS